GRYRAARARRGHLGTGRPAPAAVRVVAPAAPLRLPRRRPGAAAPAVDRRRLHRLDGRDRLLVGGLRARRRQRAAVPPRGTAVAQRPAPVDGRRRGTRGRRRGLRLPARPAPRPAAGTGRAVLLLALPRRPRVEPGASVLAVRSAPP